MTINIDYCSQQASGDSFGCRFVDHGADGLVGQSFAIAKDVDNLKYARQIVRPFINRERKRHPETPHDARELHRQLHTLSLPLLASSNTPSSLPASTS